MNFFPPWKLAIKYLDYYLRSSNGSGHGIHSPFIFHFITRILKDQQPYGAYQEIEALRKKLLQDPTIIGGRDLGAGSVIQSNRRSIATIAKYSAKPAKYAQILYRMVQAWKPGQVLELGTSLGITTSYLARANPVAKIITLEGAPEIASIASSNFKDLDIYNISLVEGNFDQTLADVLKALTSLDFCFIDGNHRMEPTLRYFREVLPKINNDSVIVFDDIHWSTEMEKAWKQVKEDPAVRCTIDLFSFGLVFFRREFMEKQHFTIRF